MKLRFLFFLLFLSVNLGAQVVPYGNEWIKKNQSYLKIKVADNGLFKITYNQLQSAGFITSNFNPKNLQLFYRGKEVPLLIEGEIDGKFDTDDYILFVGKKNDGQLDAVLYENPSFQPNPEISLFTDDSNYFLTYSSTTGKRFQNLNLNGASLIAEPYFIYTSSENFQNEYFAGQYILDVMSLSEYINGEGYVGTPFEKGSSQTKTIYTPNKATTTFKPYLEFYVAGRSNASSTSSNNHHLRVTSGSTTLKDTLYDGYATIRSKIEINNTLIQDATPINFSSINDIGAVTDYQSPSYARITYARSFDAAGFNFLNFRLNSSNSKVLLKFTNSLWQNALVLDTLNATVSKASLSSGVAEFVVSNSANTSFFVADLATAKIPVIEPVAFNIVDHTVFNSNLLIITHTSLIESANEFASYKTQKGFNPYVITTEEIYNQFYYGYHHPQAIKNLARFLLIKASQKPEYLLLLGKGVETPKFALSQDLVPTMSYPPSDAAFTSQIIDNNLAPALATGRIPAKNNQEVRDYLQKLKSYDVLPDSIYRKRLLHITGGRSTYENSVFVSYLKGLGDIAKKEFLGAELINFNKNVSDPVTDNLTDKIIKSINNGAGLVSFFGHGSTSATEVSLGNPLSYSSDRLLFYLINGCSTGNAFSASSLGETYILLKNRGAIGWIGTSSEGVGSYLAEFSKILYTKTFNTNYGKSVAKNLQLTTRDYQSPNDVLNRAHTLQYIYLGDPTVAFYSPAKPDYEVRKQDIFLTTPNLDANTKSLQFGIIVKNLGKATADRLAVSIKRTLDDKSIITYPTQLFDPVYNADTLFVMIPNDILNSAGNNTFLITLDPQNAIPELNKSNNFTTFNYFIPSNGLTIIYPYLNSIINNSTPTLTAQHNNLFVKSAEYLFEIDTINTFNSGWKKASAVVTAGLFANWQPPVQLEANKVYYWRAKLNLEAGNGGGWFKSAFTYIPNSTDGWNQGHYQQFTDLSFNKIEPEISGRSYNFTKTTFPILIRTRGNSAPNTTERAIRVSISAGKFSFNTSEFQGISILALSPLKQGVAFSYPSAFNFRNDGINYTGQYYFNPAIASEADSLARYLNNIPNGYYVLGMSGVNLSLKNLPENVKAALKNLGLSKFESIGLGEPYAFSGTKGAAEGLALEKTADYGSGIPASDQNFDFSFNLLYPFNSGYYLSSKVGPAKSWAKVSFNFSTDNTDEIKYSVVGIKNDENEVVLFNELTTPDIDISNISATEYPYIKLKTQVTDNTNFSPANLKSWKVLYQPVEEISINTEVSNIFNAPQISQGDTLKLKVGFSNIGKPITDSIIVNYKIIKNDRSEINGLVGNFAPLETGKSNVFNFTYPTTSLADSNILNITIQPKSRPDMLSFNNQINNHFFVETDNKEPLVDVLFDGRRIMNGETVSPKPQISIAIADENRFTLLNDTTSVEVYLKSKLSGIEKRIAFSSNKLIISKTGSADNNTITYLYLPDNLADGNYVLRVKSKDKFANSNTVNDFTIDFEVVNEASITHFLPYPNPFTSAMKFVFKITGQKVPDKIKIQIMTVSGKIVREVLKDELGDIHVGNNISAFTWDGTDQFGDRLANGVYFYSVSVENTDKSEIKHKATSTDSMFKKNFGKIYLMR